jgi:hypothetical protein
MIGGQCNLQNRARPRRQLISTVYTKIENIMNIEQPAAGLALEMKSCVCKVLSQLINTLIDHTHRNTIKPAHDH